MKYWPDRSSSATQFAFLRDPERRAGRFKVSKRSAAALLKKERERHCHPTARAPSCYEKTTYELSPPEAAHHFRFHNPNANGRSSRMELGLCLSDCSAIL